MKKMVCAAALATCGAAMAITDAEIEKLIGEMTLEEKVGQLVQLGYWSKDRLVPAAGPMRAWITRDSVSGKALEFRL